MIYLFEISIILLIFFILNSYSFIIGKRLSLIDKKENVPLLGGIILILGICLNLFHLYYFKNLLNKDLIIFYFLFSMFLISILDDRFNLSPLIRLFLCSLIISFFFTELDFLIRTLNFKYLGLFFFPDNIFITYFFSIFCIIVLIHAYNFIDGVNGLAIIVGIIWFIYLSFKFPNILETYIVFLIFILISLYLNLKNKIFLGDSGNYIISSLIGVIIIAENLSNPTIFYVEEIFLLFLLPGLDLIRLFFLRIKNKKNPLHGDLNHFHHLLLKKYSLKKTLLIYSVLITFPLFIFKINEELLFTLLFLEVLTYIILLKKISNGKSN